MGNLTFNTFKVAIRYISCCIEISSINDIINIHNYHRHNFRMTRIITGTHCYNSVLCKYVSINSHTFPIKSCINSIINIFSKIRCVYISFLNRTSNNSWIPPLPNCGIFTCNNVRYCSITLNSGWCITTLQSKNIFSG
ncbi:hypothetical protein D3C76_900290 [compost metagenome]